MFFDMSGYVVMPCGHVSSVNQLSLTASCQKSLLLDVFFFFALLLASNPSISSFIWKTKIFH